MHSSEVQVAIITPTYNAGNHIMACIESVQSQTYRDVEHIIVDGGSTDDTVALVEAAIRKYPGIRIVSEKDKGIYDAMNKGIRMAAARWIYFLGADDTLYEAGTLQQVAGYLDGASADIVYGDVFFMQRQRVYDHAFTMEKILSRNLCHQSMFYRRSVFDRMGGFNLRYATESDYAYNLNCWLSGRVRHQYIPVLVAHYADGGKSSLQRDPDFVSDFPVLVSNALLSGSLGGFKKVHFLAALYRKMLQRKAYRLRDLAKQLFVSRHFLVRMAAFAWMILSLPFYFFRLINNSEISNGLH